MVRSRQSPNFYVRPLFALLGFAILFSSASFANTGITYHGKILKPNGDPVDSNNVQFRIQVRTPGTENCLLWEESQSRDMSTTAGVFTLTIGDVSEPTRVQTPVTNPNTAANFTLDQIFSNRSAFASGLVGCAIGDAYSPGASDGRSLVVSFRENPGDPWEQMPVTKINYVPLAMNSLQLEGFRASEFLKLQPSVTQTPLSQTQVNTLLAILNGTAGASFDVAKTDSFVGDVTGPYNNTVVARIRGVNVSATAPANGQVLKLVGGVWTPSADDTGAAPGDATYAAKGVVQVDTSQAVSGLTLASGILSMPNVIAAAGPIGSAQNIPVITYDSKGRLITVSTTVVDDTTKLPLAGGTLTGPLNMGSQNITNANNISATNVSANAVSTRSVVLNDNDTNTVTLRTPNDITTNYTLTLPAAVPTNGFVLSTNGTGDLSWVDPTTFSGSGQFSNNGNSFGVPAILGTNDNQPLSFETNGTTKMTVLANGNVGIGTAAPGSAFEIAGYNGASLTYENFFSTLTLRGNGDPSPAIFQMRSTNSSRIRMYSGGGQVTSFWEFGMLGPAVGAGDRDFSIQEDEATPRFVLKKTTGNVGIGTTNPATRLDVSGTLKIANGAEACSIASDGGMVRYNGGNLQFCNGSAWQTLGVSGAGLTSLGGQTGSTQTFAVNATGTAPAINSATNVHTLSIPLASGVGVTSGTISKTDYDAFIAKLTSPLTTKGDLLSRDTTTHVRVPAGTNGQILSANSATASGLEWITPAAGDITGVTAGAGLITGGTSGDVTLDVGAGTGIVVNADNVAVDVGLAANRIPQVGGTALGAGGAIVANGTGTALSSLNCTLGQVIKFDVSGFATCGTDDGGASSTFVQNGNSFGAAATLGTNDNFALNFETNGTTKMTVLANGNVGIGTATPTYALSVRPTNGPANQTVFIQDTTPVTGQTKLLLQAGAVESNNDIIDVRDSSGNQRFVVRWDIGSGSTTAYSDRFGPTPGAQQVMLFGNRYGGSAGPSVQVTDFSGNRTSTSGVSQTMDIDLSFAPNSGNGVGQILSLSGTINQTGTANGVTRGLFVAPTVTSATDYRAIETTVGNVILASTSGRVGIGTTSPNTTLDINGALSQRSMAAPALSPAGQGRIYFDSTSNKFRVSENGGAYADLVGSGGAGSFINGGNSFGAAATLGTNDNFALNLETNGATQMTILNNGNVGIGTTSPGKPLEIVTNATSAFLLRRNASTGISLSPFWPGVGFNISHDGTTWRSIGSGFTGLLGIDPSTGDFQYSAGGNSTFSNENMGGFTNPTFVVKASGNVGVGTASPGSRLHVVGDGTSSLMVSNGMVTAPAGSGLQIRAPAGQFLSLEGSGGTGVISVGNGIGLLADSTVAGNLQVQGLISSANAPGSNTRITTVNAADRVDIQRTIINSLGSVNFDGNVGIGTSSPNTTLDINGALSQRSMAAPALSPAGQGRIYFDSTSNKFRVSENGGAYTDLVSAAGSSGFLNGGNSFGATATLGTNDNFSLNFETNNTTQMTILSSGNVGVGTTNPGAKLQVDGNVRINGASTAGTGSFTNVSQFDPNGVRITGSAVNGTDAITYQSGSTGGGAAVSFGRGGSWDTFMGFYTNPSSGSSIGAMVERMRLDSEGRLGIGTTNPGARLEVAGTRAFDDGGGQVAIGVVGSSGGLNFRRGSDASPQGFLGYVTGADVSHVQLRSDGGGSQLSFRTAGFERVRIDASGNFGIGTSSPNTILDLNGALSQRSMAAPALSPAGQGRIYFDSTSNKFRVSENGGAYTDLVGSAGASNLDALTDARTDYTTDFNMFLGSSSGNAIASGGQFNLGLGQSTLASLTTGDRNLAIGHQALNQSTTGLSNIAIGTNTLGFNNPGSYNVAMGDSALFNNSGNVGSNNTAIGHSAGTFSTGSNNAFFGYSSGVSPGAATGNAGFGYFSLGGATGSFNTGLGSNAGYGISGQRNVAIGNASMFSNGSNSPGSYNTYVGESTAADNVPKVGDHNTTLGYNTLNDATSAAQNTVIGSQAGSNITTGSSNILIGYNVPASSATVSNELNIGATIFGDLANDRVRIGGTGPVSAFSDLDLAGSLALKVSAGTAAQRPGTPANGMIRYNTDANKLEAYENGAWANMIGSGGAGGFLNGGNSFGTSATLGTNDNFSLNFETNGTTKMTVLPNGSVGIGNTNPSGPLHIVGQGQGTAVYFQSLENGTYGAPTLYFTNENAGFNHLSSGDNLGAIAFRNGPQGTWTAGARFTAVASENQSAANAGTSLSFSTTANGTTSLQERLRINHNGNVGIGTSSPSATLELASSTSDPGIKINRGALDSTDIYQSNVGFYLVQNAAQPLNLTTLLNSPIVFNTSNTERVRITGAGNVGIGTTSPSGQLEVQASNTSTGAYIVNASSSAARYPSMNVMNFDGTGFGGSPGFALYGSRGSSASPLATQDNDQLGKIEFYGKYGTIAGNFNRGATIEAFADENYTSAAAGSILAFRTASIGSNLDTERMRIDSSGRVGIGTSSPSAIFHVERSTGALSSLTASQHDLYVYPSAPTSGDYRAQQNYVGAGGSSNFTGTFAGSSNIVHWDSTTATASNAIGAINKAENGSSGIIAAGVGTLSESQNMSTGVISTAMGTRIVVSNDSTGTITNAIGAEIAINRPSGTITNATGLYIGTIQGTNRYSIYAADSAAPNYLAGHLGVGAVPGAFKLEATDTLSSAPIAKFNNAATTNTADGIIVKINAATLGTGNDFIQFQKDSDVVIGQIEANSNTSVQYTTTSDRRLKENIEPTAFSLDDLLKIQVRDYNYRGDNRPMNGFIAQELQEIYPQAVSRPEDEEKGYWGIDYGKVTPLIVKAIQDFYQKWIIDRQETKREIASLQSENKNLKVEVEQLKSQNKDLELRLKRIEEKILSRP